MDFNLVVVIKTAKPPNFPAIQYVFNPRRMREGYGSRSVCVSVTALAATNLFYTLKTRYH